MINSTNTVELNYNKNINSQEIITTLPPTDNMVPSSEKLNPIHHPHLQIPQNNNLRFFNKLTEPLWSQEHQQHKQNAYPPDEVYTPKHLEVNRSTDKKANTIYKERVKVQHLQTHTQLQNNRWNYQQFSQFSQNFSNESEEDMLLNNNDNNNVRNESAFNVCAGSNVMDEEQNYFDKDKRSAGTENNNNNIACKANAAAGDRRLTPPIARTEDQENAFRRIEDVHNYAKLKRYSYSNGGSSNSSMQEEEEEEEEEDDDDDVVDDMDNKADNPNVHGEDLDANYKGYINNHLHPHSTARQRLLQKLAANQALNVQRVEREDSDTHVDVETVQKEPFEMESATTVAVTPEHHARRPMNAFLIFCKRHRAIVKDRYKSLENRAITKILGDWWASLDANDKKSFTTLAQMNKDAFFSANPNFKWYKLPAPPLRTLSTRPSNANQESEAVIEEDDKPQTGSNYFKFADEAQMGELSSLMGSNSEDKCKATAAQLQQALGETTDFLNTHMQPYLDQHHTGVTASGVKRCIQSENSFSSNSSEEDALMPRRKTSRSCKGKIYQELINSGQIALAITKKLKTSPKMAQHEFMPDFDVQQKNARNFACTTSTVSPLHDTSRAAFADRRTVSESESCSAQNYELSSFDLEEKIKELPALSLDAYLQRKRNTKKKKKFNSKKRNASLSVPSSKYNSSYTTTNITTAITSATSNNSLVPNSPSTPVQPQTPHTATRQDHPHPQSQAVGSQKRKARKESITRRDVSAIENEVASLLSSHCPAFTAVNGCYYFNEGPSTTVASVGRSPAAIGQTSVETIDQFSNERISAQLTNDVSSPTSDLLILAEVAANRTELTN